MDYQIRGRVEAAAAGRFMAIVQAKPSIGEEMKELRETYSTRALAVAGLRRLAVKLGAMIRAQGDDVIDVNTED